MTIGYNDRLEGFEKNLRDLALYVGAALRGRPFAIAHAKGGHGGPPLHMI